MTNAAASDSTTSGVELRKSGNKAEVRALTDNETKHLSDPKFSPKKTSASPVWSAHAARCRDGAARAPQRRVRGQEERRRSHSDTASHAPTGPFAGPPLEPDDRRAVAAFRGAGGLVATHQRMPRQDLAHRGPQRACPFPMHDP